jgi:hypothetical protein
LFTIAAMVLPAEVVPPAPAVEDPNSPNTPDQQVTRA